MRCLVFDTESTGIPLWKERSHHPDQPLPVQVAWASFTTDEPKEITRFDELVKYDEAPKMDPGALDIHKIETARSQAEGMHISTVIERFIWHLGAVDLLIAHSFNFDRRIMASAGHRGGRPDLGDMLKDKLHYCTMMSTTKLCQIPQTNGRGGYKWPKLEEALDALGLDPITIAHDAAGDVDGCLRLFLKLWDMGHVTEDEFKVKL